MVLVGAAITFAVRNGQHEEKARAAETEQAGEEIEGTRKTRVPAGGSSQGESVDGGGAGSCPRGPRRHPALAASPTELAFDKTQLSSKPGKVTIDFENPAPLEHNVAIEQDGEVIAESETLAEGKTTVSAELAPGTYTFLCTIPGHAEAGMEGTLTVR